MYAYCYGFVIEITFTVMNSAKRQTVPEEGSDSDAGQSDVPELSLTSTLVPTVQPRGLIPAFGGEVATSHYQ